jgi:hypothetical protein
VELKFAVIKKNYKLNLLFDQIILLVCCHGICSILKLIKSTITVDYVQKINATLKLRRRRNEQE